MSRLTIFLSHLTVESKLGDIFEKRISRDFIGLVKVWISSNTTTIPVGSKWLDELQDGLRKADLQIVLCSNDSVTRQWINYEVGAAGIRGIPTIPFCHTGFLPPHLPVPLSESQAFVNTPKDLRSLYQTIADKLESTVPEIDFEAFSQEIAGFENEYRNHLDTVTKNGKMEPSQEKIVDPSVLCVTSKQFLELGFQNQLETVISAFPSTVSHAFVLNSLDFRKALTVQNVEILHISAYVCPRSGDLYFSEVDSQSGKSVAAEPDRVLADDVRELCKGAKTRLVVIGSCDSLALATMLVRDMNVIAANDMNSAKAMTAWISTFYLSLPNLSLSASFDRAIKASGAKVRLLAQQEMFFSVRNIVDAVSSNQEVENKLAGSQEDSLH